MIAGEGRDEPSAPLVPPGAAAEALVEDAAAMDDAALWSRPAVREALGARPGASAAFATGSSKRVARAVVMTEPLDLADGEVTDMGAVNERGPGPAPRPDRADVRRPASGDPRRSSLPRPDKSVRVEGAAALVDGAGSGLGAATARMLAAGGAHVVVLDCDTQAARRIADETFGTPACTDVTDEAGVTDALDAAPETPRIVINRAGIGTAGRLVQRDGPIARADFELGIRVKTTAPAIFRTPLLGTMPPEARAALPAGIPCPARLGAPDEFAAAVRFRVETDDPNGKVIRIGGTARLAPRRSPNSRPGSCASARRCGPCRTPSARTSTSISWTPCSKGPGGSPTTCRPRPTRSRTARAL